MRNFIRFRTCDIYVLATLVAMLFGSSLPARADSIGFSIADNTPAVGSDQLNVTVLDNQTLTPVEGAKVSITNGLGFGPVSLRLPADALGEVSFRDASPVPKTITVTQPGYATLSIVGVQGTDLTVYLKPLIHNSAQSSATVVATGTITDWDGVNTDSSVVHAGMVFRTASATDLLHFQISDFVSPLKDTIDLGSIAGSHEIPSNVVLPDQSASYLFFNVELNKPAYRLPIPANEALSLTGVEIEADVSDLVSAAQSHSFNIDLLNKVRFKRAGMTENFTATQDFTHDVQATMALAATHQVSISQAPPFTGDVVAASFTDVNGDKSALVPSDAKVIYNHADGGDPSDATQAQATLAAPQTSAPGSALAVATVALGTQGQISGVLVEPAGATVQAGAFLNTDALPQDQSALPATVTVHSPTQGIGAAIFQTDQPVWYVYTLPIAGDVQVPTAKLAAGENIQSYSVNQVEFSSFNPKSVDGTKIMSFLQRFARSSAKIKAGT